MRRYSKDFKVVTMAKALDVSLSGYYAFTRRKPSKRELENEQLVIEIKDIFFESNRSYGSTKIWRAVNDNPKREKRVNFKRIVNLMQTNNIVSKVSKKYKATTNSKHGLPVAENLLDRDFKADGPMQKLVSDITYIPTDEGWLYVAGVLDLFGKKMVGIAMDDNMRAELTCEAMLDAVNRQGKPKGKCLAHSDRGVQYASHKYQQLLWSCGMTCSMSRKGNCWDNAPMESFWGKMKQEWLNEQHFKTREEAKSAVFEYVWIFHNRKRIHASNDYLTPDAYYAKAA
jgi:putative transposase